MNSKSTIILPLLTLGCLVASVAASTITIPLVTVGDPGNVADPATGYGNVNYVYQIGEYDVTIGQYTAFLNAVATTSDPYGLYNAGMAPAQPPGHFATLGIAQVGSPGNYSYSVAGSYSQGRNCPIFDVTWGDAARFVNWLANGQPTGPEGPGTTETGTYTLSGTTTNAGLMQVTRNPGSTWVLPTVDEWYKSAYYFGGGTNAGYWMYATQSNTLPSNVLSATGTNNANFFSVDTGGFSDPNYLTPVGAFAASPSAYGTDDQGGDVGQWNETGYGGTARGFRGGSFDSGFGILLSTTNEATDPAFADIDIGFRVAYVPEPYGACIALCRAIASLLFINCQRLINKQGVSYALQHLVLGGAMWKSALPLGEADRHASVLPIPAHSGTSTWARMRSWIASLCNEVAAKHRFRKAGCARGT